jgi:membrane protein DedA with SNARE-associated domain
LRVPAALAIGAMAVASAIWYGMISYVAFRAGSDWDGMLDLLKRSGRVSALAALALASLGAVAWIVARRRRSRA